MSTTSRQDEAFLLNIMPAGLLGDAIEWIRSNLNPDDVFSSKDLDQWAEGEGYVKKTDNDN